MVASGDFTSADGPGGKASRFLDAVVAFVVGIFQPIFRFLLSAIFTRKSRQHNNQNRDRDNTLGDSPRNNNNNGDHDDTRANHDGQRGDHEGDDSPESMQRHSNNARPQHAYGPKAANGNAPPPVKPALPQIGPAVNSPRPVRQDAVPTNGVPLKTPLDDVTNGVQHTSKHHIVGEKEAEENLHDQVDLAPAVQPVEGEEGPEDPAMAAERAVHHGFMDQALDMVCPASSFFYWLSSKTSLSMRTRAVSLTMCLYLCVNPFLDAHRVVIPLSCFTRSFCRVSKLSTNLHAFPPRVGNASFISSHRTSRPGISLQHQPDPATFWASPLLFTCPTMLTQSFVGPPGSEDQ